MILLSERIYLDLDLKIRYVDIDSVDDTGYGPLEFLDIGAYEFQGTPVNRLPILTKKNLQFIKTSDSLELSVDFIDSGEVY